MNMNDVSLVILAAGKGSRLNQEQPKPLVPLEGTPLIDTILTLGKTFSFAGIYIVISEYTQAICQEYPDPVYNYIMTSPRGTADAVWQVLPHITTSQILIAQADDSFFYTEETLRRLMRDHQTFKADFTLGAAYTQESIPYTACVYDQDQRFRSLKEKPALPGESVACGLYMGQTDWLRKHFASLPPNEQGEYGIPTSYCARAGEDEIYVSLVPHQEWQGINTPEELEKARGMYKISKI